MLLAKLKTIVTAVLAVAVVAGAGGLAYSGQAGEPPAKEGKQTDNPRNDKNAILGAWQVVKVEEDGKDASETDDGKRFLSAPWTITKDKILLGSGAEMRYELDAFAKPKAIDLDNGGDKKFACVYSLDGDTLKICAPLKPGGGRPAEVASKQGGGTRILVLKRQAKDK
jgi:uncharacterized protein (TIGR03067 family)